MFCKSQLAHCFQSPCQPIGLSDLLIDLALKTLAYLEILSPVVHQRGNPLVFVHKLVPETVQLKYFLLEAGSGHLES